MINDLDYYLGETQRNIDGTYSGWYASKNKDSFIRYYELGFREVLHKTTDDCGDTVWTISPNGTLYPPPA